MALESDSGGDLGMFGPIEPILAKSSLLNNRGRIISQEEIEPSPIPELVDELSRHRLLSPNDEYFLPLGDGDRLRLFRRQGQLETIIIPLEGYNFLELVHRLPADPLYEKGRIVRESIFSFDEHGKPYPRVNVDNQDTTQSWSVYSRSQFYNKLVLETSRMTFGKDEAGFVDTSSKVSEEEIQSLTIGPRDKSKNIFLTRRIVYGQNSAKLDGSVLISSNFINPQIRLVTGCYLLTPQFVNDLNSKKIADLFNPIADKPFENLAEDLYEVEDENSLEEILGPGSVSLYAQIHNDSNLQASFWRREWRDRVRYSRVRVQDRGVGLSYDSYVEDHKMRYKIEMNSHRLYSALTISHKQDSDQFIRFSNVY